jgi:hypothetical protein
MNSHHLSAAAVAMEERGLVWGERRQQFVVNNVKGGCFHFGLSFTLLSVITRRSIFVMLCFLIFY